MELEEAFRAEIRFWDDMLRIQSDQTEPDILQRMQMAKRLAERKLELFTAEYSGEIN